MKHRIVSGVAILLLAVGLFIPLATAVVTAVLPRSYSSTVRLVERTPASPSTPPFQRFQSAEALDLVITDRNAQAGVGAGRWQIFAGACDSR